MKSLTTELAPWADLDHLAIDFRFPYQIAGSVPYISYLALYDRYFDGQLGQHHRSQVPRFIADFGYDQEHAYRQMHTDFSFNVHPSHHMQSTAMAGNALFIFEHMRGRLPKIAKWLPKQDIPIVRLTNILHDVGENDSPQLAVAVGGVIGDIAHGKKTPEHKQQESKIRKYIFETHYSDIPEYVMQRVESLCAHTEDSPAHQTYVWSHDLERLQTAMIASDHAQHIIQADKPRDVRYSQLVKLALEVGSGALHDLQPARKIFHAIGCIIGRAEASFEQLNQLK